MNRELNSTDIRCMAEGYWGKHFNWRIHPKFLVWMIAVILLIGAAVPFWVIGANRSADNDVKVITVSPKDPSTITILLEDSRNDITVLQNGDLPTIERDIKDSTAKDYLAIALVLSLLSALCLMAGLISYGSSRSKYFTWCVNRWEQEPNKEMRILPNDESINEFLKMKVK